jgi:hypothetical protein
MQVNIKGKYFKKMVQWMLQLKMHILSSESWSFQLY